MKDVKLNLGCGLNAVQGWVNIDRSPSLILGKVKPLKAVLRRVGLLTEAHMVDWPSNIVMRDVLRPLPYADGSVAAIYSSHMLEHLYLSDAEAVLGECRRVLAPGGVIRVALPDGEEFAALALSGSVDDARAYTRQLNAHPLEPPTIAQRLRRPFSGSPHRWQPTRPLIAAMLEGAGFACVTERQFRVGNLPGLEVVEHRGESIFYEGTA